MVKRESLSNLNQIELSVNTSAEFLRSPRESVQNYHKLQTGTPKSTHKERFQYPSTPSTTVKTLTPSATEKTRDTNAPYLRELDDIESGNRTFFGGGPPITPSSHV